MCHFVTSPRAWRKRRKDQETNQIHISALGFVPLDLGMCLLLNVKDLQLSVDQNQCVIQKNIQSAFHSVPDAQLVCTKQHDMPSFYVPFP